MRQNLLFVDMGSQIKKHRAVRMLEKGWLEIILTSRLESMPILVTPHHIGRMVPVEGKQRTSDQRGQPILHGKASLKFRPVSNIHHHSFRVSMGIERAVNSLHCVLVRF